ncbi:MAG: hypothetical protein DMG06_26350 [Acidobacteria bacterium]|nr:MAG: hypothetical protein DMG06_26350 [Acidobacteriota bacterium]
MGSFRSVGKSFHTRTPRSDLLAYLLLDTGGVSGPVCPTPWPVQDLGVRTFSIDATQDSQEIKKWFWARTRNRYFIWNPRDLSTKRLFPEGD